MSDAVSAVVAAAVDVYLYSRVSTRRQLSGMGMDVQAKSLAECLAEHPEWTVKGNFKDLGISAFRGDNRLKGEFADFLELVKTGKVRRGSVLVVFSLDRVTRDNLIEAHGLLLDLLRAGITICTTIDKKVFRPDDESGAVLMNLLVSLTVMLRSHEESLTKSGRGLKNWAEKRRREIDEGIRMTANVPAWLDMDGQRNPVENESKSKIVKRIFELHDAGHGYAGIMRTLEAEGKRSFGRSGRWSVAYIRQILSDKAVTG